MAQAQARHENIVDYVKAVIPSGVWYDASSEKGEKYSLLGALDIPGLEHADLRKWLKQEGISPSVPDGFKGIFLGRQRNHVTLAHGERPIRGINHQSNTSSAPNASDSRLPPIIPAGIRKSVQSGASASGAAPTKVGGEGSSFNVDSPNSHFHNKPSLDSTKDPQYMKHPQQLEAAAAASLLNGTCTGTLCVNGIGVNVDLNDPTRMSPLQHAMLTLLVNKSMEEAPEGRKGLVPYRTGPSTQSTSYLLPVSLSKKETACSRGIKRKAADLENFLRHSAGCSPETQAKVTTRYLSQHKETLEFVCANLRKYDTSQCISAETIATELVQKGCYSFKQIKVLKDLLDALNYYIICPVSHVRRVVKDNSTIIPKITGMIKLISKKDAHEFVNVPFLRAASLLQAALTLIHLSLARGCVSPDGVPSNEIWLKGMGDAGGNRFLYALQVVLELLLDGDELSKEREVKVNSINNTHVICAFSTECAGDTGENMKRALFGPMEAEFNFLSAENCGLLEVLIGDSYLASALVDTSAGLSLDSTLLTTVIEEKHLTILKSKHQTFQLAPQGSVVLLLSKGGGLVGLASISLYPKTGLPTYVLNHIIEYACPTFDTPQGCFLSLILAPLSSSDISTSVLQIDGSRNFGSFTRVVNVNLELVFDESESNLLVNNGLFEITGLYILPDERGIWRTSMAGENVNSSLSVQLKTVVKFEPGDLKYQCSLLAVQPTGKHPCTLCEKPTDKFCVKCSDLESSDIRMRTSDNLAEHLAALESDTTAWHHGTLERQNNTPEKGPKPIPKDYAGVEGKQLWKFNPERLCLPLLHLFLSIPLGWYRAYISLLRKLDGLSREDIERAEAVDVVVNQLQEMRELHSELVKVKIPATKKRGDELKAQARSSLSLGPTASLGLISARKKIEKMTIGEDSDKATAAVGLWDQSIKEHEVLTTESKHIFKIITDLEIVSSEIEADVKLHKGKYERAVLNCMSASFKNGGCGVQVTKHFGGSFQGNDCKQLMSYLGEGGFCFDRLLDCAMSLLKEEHEAGNRTEEDLDFWNAEILTFRSPMAKWAEISKVMGLTRKLQEDEIVFLEDQCPKFVNEYYAVVGDSKGSKLHMIKDHVGPFARKFNVLYLLCEEAIESKHARWNAYARQMARVMGKEQKFSIMAELDCLSLGDVKSDAADAIRNLKALRSRGPYKK